MKVHVLERTQELPVGRDEAFSFFAEARNLEAITPPLLRFRVLTPEPVDMRAGTRLRYRLRLHGLPVRWDTVIAAWEPPERFVDVQERGPYAIWHHTHAFEDLGGGRTRMHDVVRYGLGFGPLGEVARRAFVVRDLDAIFAFRADAVGRLLA